MYSNYFKTEKEKADFPRRMEELVKFLNGKKVVLFGIGDELKYYLDFCHFHKLDIVAISDNNANIENFENYKFTTPEELKNCKFDFILITQDNLLRAEKFLVNELKINTDKIINVLRNNLFDEKINSEYLKKINFQKHFKKIVKKLKNKKVVIYGANSLLQTIAKYCDLSQINIIAIADFKYTMKQEKEFLGYQTCAVFEINKYQPDYILVAEKYFTQSIIEHIYFTVCKNSETKILSITPNKIEPYLFKNFITGKLLTKEQKYKKIVNNIYIKFLNKPKYSFLPHYTIPNKVRLEACTICQLHCKACYMRRDGPAALGYGYLKFNDYKNFIDKNPNIKFVSLANSGEIFLNPELVEIIKYSYEKGIKLDAHTGVNLNHLSDEQAEALVKYEFGDIILSIDGASQETYSQYREKGDYNKVIANIEKINFYKQKYNSKSPNLIWKFILFNHNEHEIVLAKQKAKELGLKIVFSLPWGKNTFTPKNPDFVQKETGLKFASVTNMEAKTKKKYCHNLCERMFSAPQINYNGTLFGCCILYKESLGVNVFELGLEQALRSAEFLYSIGMLRGEYFPIDASPCTKCTEYDAITFNENYFFTK